MNDRVQGNIERINRLWRLHEPWDEASSAEGRCLAFVIDRRYIDGPEGAVELRLGVSFGHNVVTPETKQGLIGIPVHPGKYVFGMHLIGIKGDQLTLYDKWMDAKDAGDSADPVQGEERARAILSSITDAAYVPLVSADNCKGPIKISSRELLDEFEVVKGEAF